MNKTAQVIMLSCKKASYLIEKKHLDRLSILENIQVNLHTSVCKMCQLYEKQSAALNGFLKGYSKRSRSGNDLSIEKKKEIIEGLKKIDPDKKD